MKILNMIGLKDWDTLKLTFNLKFFIAKILKYNLSNKILEKMDKLQFIIEKDGSNSLKFYLKLRIPTSKDYLRL